MHSVHALLNHGNPRPQAGAYKRSGAELIALVYGYNIIVNSFTTTQYAPAYYVACISTKEVNYI
jgi:hypothetical protein